MNDNGHSHLIFAAGTVLGVLTIGMLGINTVYNFSPVIKVAIFCLLSLFLALGGICAARPLDYSLYIISFSSFVMALSLALTISSLETTTHLLIAGLGSMAFLSVGYALQKDIISPGKSQFKVYTVLVLLVLLLVVGYDLSGYQPRYSFISYEKPEVNSMGELELGKIVVDNRFQLPRTIDTPKYRACVYGSEFLAQKPVKVKGAKMVEAKSLQQLGVSTALEEELVENLEIAEMKIVRSSECISPNATDQIRIVDSKD